MTFDKLYTILMLLVLTLTWVLVSYNMSISKKIDDLSSRYDCVFNSEPLD